VHYLHHLEGLVYTVGRFLCTNSWTCLTVLGPLLQRILRTSSSPSVGCGNWCLGIFKPLQKCFCLRSKVILYESCRIVKGKNDKNRIFLKIFLQTLFFTQKPTKRCRMTRSLISNSQGVVTCYDSECYISAKKGLQNSQRIRRAPADAKTTNPLQ